MSKQQAQPQDRRIGTNTSSEKSRSKTESSGVGTNTRLTRRQMMKASGWTLGAAAVGVGGNSIGVSPVQESEALLPVLVAGGASIVTGAVGLKTYQKLTNEKQDIDESSVAENSVYDTASAIASQRAGNLRQTITQEWVNKADDKTPYADTAWNKFEAAAAKKIVNGNENEAESAAFDANNRQMAIAYYNAIQGWNQGILGSGDNDGLLGAIRLAFEQNTGQIGVVNTSYKALSHDLSYDMVGFYPSASMDDWQPVSAGEVGSSGEYVCFKKQWSPGFVNLSNIDEINEPIHIYGFPYRVRNGKDNYNHEEEVMLAPWGDYLDSSEYYGPDPDQSTYDGQMHVIGDITVSHPDRQTVTSLKGNLYNDYFASIDGTYTDLQNNQISSYVTTLNDKLAQGAISVESILGPEAALETFAGTSDQSRFAAEMTFGGIAAPSKDYSYKAKVSHPSLSVDSLWGTLFVSFSGSPQNIKPGTTIASADYSMAWLGFNREDTGEFRRKPLSGDSDLQILDVDGVGGEQDYDDGEQTAGANGEVYVWPASRDKEAPDPIQFPADHSGYSISVVGATNVSSLPVGDVKEDSEGYYLPSTGLNEGELVEKVRIAPPVEYEKPGGYIQDTSTVSTEEIETRVQQNEELITQIQELEEATTTGGLFSGGGLPTLPGLGVIESAAVVGGGILGLNLLSS